jgi:hypothetical protein
VKEAAKIGLGCSQQPLKRVTPLLPPPCTASRSGNALAGTLPATSGALGKSLQVLRLSDNPGLTGCLPSGLERFKEDEDACKGTGIECNNIC